MIEKIIKKEKDNNTCWNQVLYPCPVPYKLFGFIPIRIALMIIIIIVEIFLIGFLSEKIHVFIIQIIFLILYFYLPYKTISYYKKIVRKFQEGKNSYIENCLYYLIESNKFYDEQNFQIEDYNKSGNIVFRNEKRISRTIQLYYKETDFKVYVRIIKLGDRFTKIASNLGELFESALGLEIEYVDNSNVNYCEYSFYKHKEDIKQFVFNNLSLDRSFFENIPLDIIQLSNTQSFSLKKNTNLGIYGRTGTGKTIGLQWYLYNAVAKGCGTISDSVLSIVDGKGADLFALGSLLQKELGGNINFGQSPNSLAQLSREFIGVMNNRFELIKNSNTLNADGYDLGITPSFLFIDELASIKDSCGSSKQGKELWNEIIQNLGLIARKGRQACCHLCLATQDPNSDNIPVELRNQISAVLFLGNPSKDRLKMAFSMCELENVPTISGHKGEALFFADGNNNMVEPQITIVPFVDVKTKEDFINVIREIKPII